ncbi:MAG: CRISPR-associated protein Cas4 [Sulfurimonas sp.]|uniref:CRISPR-associated protein Cas4 n=1 Tax=Sulfurimonas sp. TaxID=2022749 RepID=UPI003564DBDF
MKKISINGTLISYYFICKTKLWLHANRINLEDNSEDVRIGKVLHEIQEKKTKKAEIKIDNVKIDKITKEYLVEFKKSDSDPEAVKWQVLLYLYKLKQKGIDRKGKIDYHEKNHNTKTEILELDEQNEKELLRVLEAIESLINLPKPPASKFENKCKKCASYEYCFI